jgi:hypothetical protein
LQQNIVRAGSDCPARPGFRIADMRLALGKIYIHPLTSMSHIFSSYREMHLYEKIIMGRKLSCQQEVQKKNDGFVVNGF